MKRNIGDQPPAIVVVTKPVNLFEMLPSEQDCASNKVVYIVISVASSVEVTEVLWVGEIHCSLVLGGIRQGWQSVHVVDTKIIRTSCYNIPSVTQISPIWNKTRLWQPVYP